MMIREDHCVGCPKEMGCIGSAGMYKDVPVYYCDNCDGDVYADYRIDGIDMCEECAEKYLNDAFEDNTIIEKAEILDIEIERIYT